MRVPVGLAVGWSLIAVYEASMAAPDAGSWLILAVNPQFMVPTLALVGSLLAGALVIALFRRWQRNARESLDLAEELTRYRALYEQGAISEEEYHSLRTILGGDLRRSMKLPPKTPTIDPEKKPDAAFTPGPSQVREEPPMPSDGIRSAD